ncbi:MAG: UbiA family prenyltransferase [Bacteroidales bacterium]|nr:UbiA family prenyltransferase [Bacteroidales bacterium]
MAKINNYLSMIKFAHSIFALPFALTGFFMALYINEVQFDYIKLIYIVLAMVFARNAAMGFNRFIDRNIDKDNPRTTMRELPAGIIKPQAALIFVIINSLLFWAVTWFINSLTFVLAPVALLVVLGYSLTKRITALCHLILGLGLSLSPIGAYLSITGAFDHWAPIALSFAVLFWTAGFDIIYALQDDEFDQGKKLYSIPQTFGRPKSLFISRILHLISALLIILSGFLFDANYVYFIGSAIFIVFLINQHRIVRINDLSNVNMAFFTMNGLASMVFGLFSIASFYIR